MSRRAATTKQAGRFRHTRQGGLPFGPPRRRGFSAYHRRQVCPRRRFLLGAKKSKPSQPGGDSERLPTTVTEPNGVVTTYSYNSLNRLTDEVVKDAGGTTLASYSYTLDNAGNRTGVTETQLLPNGTVNTRTVTYTYDNLYRLLSESITGDSQGGNGTISYTYL